MVFERFHEKLYMYTDHSKFVTFPLLRLISRKINQISFRFQCCASKISFTKKIAILQIIPFHEFSGHEKSSYRKEKEDQNMP